MAPQKPSEAISDDLNLVSRRRRQGGVCSCNTVADLEGFLGFHGTPPPPSQDKVNELWLSCHHRLNSMFACMQKKENK